MRASFLCLLALTAIGCAAVDPEGPADGTGSKSDGHEGIEGLRDFYLVGNALTAGHDAVDLFVVGGAAGVSQSDLVLRLDGEPFGACRSEGAGVRCRGELEGVGVGEHELVIGAVAHRFVRAHPLYVVVSTDWDTSDNTDAQMARQDELHDRHPELRLTHFVGPYTFTDPDLAPDRVEWLVGWLLDARARHGDEVGLHIHPYCHFVDTTDVTCRTEPTYANSWRGPGYTVPSSAYTEDEMTTLLETAQALFEMHGLPTPRTFRAGGWALELHTMRALANAGFLADTSANNWRRLEEWRGSTGTSLYDDNARWWEPIGDTSQPWYPAEDDLMASGPPSLPVLEVPDNGSLADYVSAAEMIEIFEANYDVRATEPRQVSIGYHPPSLDATNFARIDGALDHIDQHLASDDAGAVVYAVLSELPEVWQLTPR